MSLTTKVVLSNAVLGVLEPARRLLEVERSPASEIITQILADANATGRIRYGHKYCEMNADDRALLQMVERLVQVALKFKISPEYEPSKTGTTLREQIAIATVLLPTDDSTGSPH